MLATFMEVLDTSVANVALPHIAGNLSAGVGRVDLGADRVSRGQRDRAAAQRLVLDALRPQALLHGVRRRSSRSARCCAASRRRSRCSSSSASCRGWAAARCSRSRRRSWSRASRREKQGVATAFYGMGVVVAPVIGPTLGGWITDNYSWRWIFLINIPVGILSILLTTMLITDPPHLVRKTFKTGLKLDYIGSGLLRHWSGRARDHARRRAAQGLVRVAHDRRGGDHRLGLRWSAVVVWELRQAEPMVDFRILEEPQLRSGRGDDVCRRVHALRQHRAAADLPADDPGLHGAAQRPGAVARRRGDDDRVRDGRPAARHRAGADADRVRPAGVGASAPIRCRVSISRSTSGPRCGRARCRRSGWRFCSCPINVAAFSAVPREKLGYATGLMNLFRNIGGSAGHRDGHDDDGAPAAVPSGDRWSATSRRSIRATPTCCRARPPTLVAQGASAVDAAGQAQGMLYGMVQRQAAMMAVTDTFWVLSLVFPRHGAAGAVDQADRASDRPHPRRLTHL